MEHPTLTVSLYFLLCLDNQDVTYSVEMHMTVMTIFGKLLTYPVWGMETLCTRRCLYYYISV